MFHLCIIGSLAVKTIESSTRLVVCDDERVIDEPFYSIYFTCELYISEPYTASLSAEILLQSELSIGLADEFAIERFEVLFSLGEPRILDWLVESFFSQTLLELGIEDFFFV